MQAAGGISMCMIYDDYEASFYVQDWVVSTKAFIIIIRP